MQLATARLTLRDFIFDDWHALYAYQRDPRYLRYYEWTEERSVEDVQKFVQMFLDQQKASPRTKFQLALVLEGQVIGNCGVRRETETEGSLGYEVNPAYWGQGYATEAARAMLKFGFAELKFHRIHAWCVAENVASARVLEKVGMKREGLLRERSFYKGKWWNEVVYGILENEQ